MNLPTAVINGVVNPNVTDFGTTLWETKSASYFGQLNYDYQGKYLLAQHFGMMDFSNFAPENKYAFFPSVSAGWNVHREKFWTIEAVSYIEAEG